MSKVVKRLKAKKLDEDEPLVESIPDDVPSEDTAFREASDILHALAKTTPNLMGTAHGLALIHAAQKWVAQHEA